MFRFHQFLHAIILVHDYCLLSFKKKQLLLWSIFDGWAFDMSNHTNLPLLYIHTYCLRLEVISSLGFPNIIGKMSSGMRFVIYVDFRDWNERFLLSQILLIPYPIRSMYGVHLPIYRYIDWVYDACRYILDLPRTQDSSHHQDDFHFRIGYPHPQTFICLDCILGER